MEKEFIPYEQALALKELGFNEPCVGFFENDRQGSKIQFTYFHTIKDYNSIESDGLLELFGTKTREEKKQILIEQNLLFPWTSAPTYSQAFRWFLKKHGLAWEHSFDDSQIQLYVGKITYPDNSLEFFKSIEVKYDGYNEAIEEAELECLKKLIEIVKNK